MSLILEALNRARREQQNAAPVPGVDSVHFEAESQPHRQRWFWFLLAAAGVLVVGILLGGYVTRVAGPAPQAPLQPATPAVPSTSASTWPSPLGSDRVAVPKNSTGDGRRLAMRPCSSRWAQTT